MAISCWPAARDQQRYLGVFGVSAGAGWEVPGHEAASAWSAEVRYRFTPQRYDEPTDYRFVTLAVGRRWDW